MFEKFGGWIFGGKLENGESFYSKPSGELAVEKDFAHLAEPTPGELWEIFSRFPHLQPPETGPSTG